MLWKGKAEKVGLTLFFSANGLIFSQFLDISYEMTNLMCEQIQ